MRTSLNYWTLGLAIWCSAVSQASAGWSAGVGWESFIWREYDGGDLLLEEVGPRPVAMLDYAGEGDTALRLSGRIYSGEVQYSGQYMDGTPVTTTTLYNGAMAEAGMAVFPDRSYSETALYFGLGLESWERDLTGPGGYVENYQAGFMRMGLESGASAFDPWSLRFGLIWPFQIKEQVHLYDGIDLSPKGAMSFYAGFGYRFGESVEVALDYRGLRFAPSDDEELDDDDDQKVTYVHQPRSELDALMVSLRYYF